jgi:microcystin-dependent protein
VSAPFLGEIRPFGFNFAPRGWALCDGQLLSIQQNTALFSLLGTQYGGNGVQDFALPDLRGRTALHQGQGPGLTGRSVGERSGEEAHTLTTNQMPQHTHAIAASNSDASSNRPSTQRGPARGGAYDTGSDSEMRPPTPTGGSQPHNNMQPYLVVSYCIALQGIFPARN